jgi:hypothetical protein
LPNIEKLGHQRYLYSEMYRLIPRPMVRDGIAGGIDDAACGITVSGAEA